MGNQKPGIYGLLLRLPGKIVTSKDVGTSCNERGMVPRVCIWHSAFGSTSASCKVLFSMQSTSYESKTCEWEGINSYERLFPRGVVPFNVGIQAGNSFKYQKVDRRQNVI